MVVQGSGSGLATTKERGRPLDLTSSGLLQSVAQARLLLELVQDSSGGVEELVEFFNPNPNHLNVRAPAMFEYAEFPTPLDARTR